MCVSGGVSVGWIGLSEAEVRPALLIIGRTKYSPTAWLRVQRRKKVPGGRENQSGSNRSEHGGEETERNEAKRKRDGENGRAEAEGVVGINCSWSERSVV